MAPALMLCAHGCGISRGRSIYELYRGTVKRVDLTTLEKLCKHFDVSVGEILEYEADK